MKRQAKATKIQTRRHSDGTWAIRVPKCPHCGAPHFHGGGDGDEPELGHRVAHCGLGGYDLEFGPPVTQKRDVKPRHN